MRQFTFEMKQKIKGKMCWLGGKIKCIFFFIKRKKIQKWITHSNIEKMGLEKSNLDGVFFSRKTRDSCEEQKYVSLYRMSKILESNPSKLVLYYFWDCLSMPYFNNVALFMRWYDVLIKALHSSRLKSGKKCNLMKMHCCLKG